MATRRPTDDDSDEEEATAIDLRSSSQAFKPASSGIGARPAAPQSQAKKPPVTSSTPPKPLHSSSDDEEATEFLAMRPSSSGIASEPASSPSSLRARGRAVPLEGGARAEASTPGVPAPEKKTSKEELLADLPTGPTAIPTALPTRTPRPLPGERQTNVKSETQTGSSQKSAPRITRIFQADSGTHERIAGIGTGIGSGNVDPASTTAPGDEDEVTDPPAPSPVKPRPLPERADAAVPSRPAPRPATIVVHGLPDEKRTDERATDEVSRRPNTQKTSQPTSETLEAEPAEGTLIVEVPEGSVVFINGIERGRGPSLKVNGIDRYAKHAVRIHAPGHAPWSGSVCLEGRTAAKIRPSLKPKR